MPAKRQKINKPRVRKFHKALNWSSSVVNSTFRNALKGNGKIVAATDYDLVIYTQKGACVILEQKNRLQDLLKFKKFEVSKIQIDHLLQTASRLQPSPSVWLVVYDAQDVDAKREKSRIMICDLKANVDKMQTVKRGSWQYVVRLRDCRAAFISDLHNLVNAQIASPKFERLPLPHNMRAIAHNIASEIRSLRVPVDYINKRQKIYVAGPYLAMPQGRILYSTKGDGKTLATFDRADFHKCVRETALNAERAIQAGIALMKKGHLPYIPHLSHFIHQRADVDFDDQYWYDFDNQWLDECDALLFIGHSKGADAELNRAIDNGMQIYYDIADVPSYNEETKARFD